MDDEVMAADLTPPGVTPAQLLRTPANRVSARAVRYWFTRALVGWLIVVGVQVVAWIFDWPIPPWHPQVLTATVLIAVVHLAVMPRWRYRVHRWELTEDAVYTRSGWWTQEWRIAPVSRIQTVDTERGPIGRLFHLTKVTVTTASAAGPLTIDGLDEGVAAQFALQVTAAAQATRGDAT
jgi:membrane protein YdbS with pleckstrin-like domain